MTESTSQPVSDEREEDLPVNQVAAAASEKYDETQIRALKGIEGIRTRPSMYIGDTTLRGLHHLVYEVVDNSVDEAVNGFAKRCRLFIRLHADSSVSISDDGRGIPVGLMADQGNQPALEVVLTEIHAGGKFEPRKRL